MSAGDRYLPERRQFQDAVTGATIVQYTDTACINHAPYFLNQAWAFPHGRDNGACLIVTSYRNGGRPNLFAVDEAGGELRQLTDRGDVNPWSACVSRDGRRVFYGAGRALRVLDLATAHDETVAICPGDRGLNTCSLSPDGTELVTSAFSGATNSSSGRSALLAVRTDGSGIRRIYETGSPIFHVQFSPDGRHVLFAGERPRLWLVGRDGADPHPLRGQTRREWLTHEAWLGDDEVIFTHWPHALKSIRRDGSSERTIAAFNCWHPAPRADGRLIVCDTTLPDDGLVLVDPANGARRTLCYPKASCQGYRWALQEPSWEDDSGAAAPEAAYGPQWTHPHPSFSPDGTKVAYTSDASGFSQVYVAQL